MLGLGTTPNDESKSIQASSARVKAPGTDVWKPRRSSSAIVFGKSPIDSKFFRAISMTFISCSIQCTRRVGSIFALYTVLTLLSVSSVSFTLDVGFRGAPRRWKHMSDSFPNLSTGEPYTGLKQSFTWQTISSNMFNRVAITENMLSFRNVGFNDAQSSPFSLVPCKA